MERELRRLARSSLEKIGPERIEAMVDAYKLASVDDFFAAIGYGAISAQQVVARLDVVTTEGATEQVLPQVAPPSAARTDGVRVKGVGDLMIRFANCCHPIPGDAIMGYITRGRGVTVHQVTCPTVVNERELGRLIDVEWEGGAQQTYPIAIRVDAYDRQGLLNEITNVVAEHKVNIIAANVKVNPDHTATIQATLQVASVDQLARVLSRIEQLKDVHAVQRELS
jgi:GTP pyrophosphokinase